jgi:hypothetical protein
LHVFVFFSFFFVFAFVVEKCYLLAVVLLLVSRLT